MNIIVGLNYVNFTIIFIIIINVRKLEEYIYLCRINMYMVNGGEKMG